MGGVCAAYISTGAGCEVARAAAQRCHRRCCCQLPAAAFKGLPLLPWAAHLPRDNLPLTSSRSSGMDDDVQRVLHEAAISGDVRLLESAIAKGVDVNAVRRGSTALCSACLNGHHECVQRLLATGADPSLRAVVAATQVSLTPLHLAASHQSDGHTICVGALLQAGADPWASFGADRSVALHLAAGLASVDAVRLLCEVAQFRVSACRHKTFYAAADRCSEKQPLSV